MTVDWDRRREYRREREKRIVARVAELLHRGWSMRQIALLPDTPGIATLRRWTRKDHLNLGMIYRDELRDRYLEELHRRERVCTVQEEAGRLFYSMVDRMFDRRSDTEPARSERK